MKKVFALSCVVCVLLMLFIGCVIAVDPTPPDTGNRPPMRLFPSLPNAFDAMMRKHGEWEELGSSKTEVGTYTNGMKTGVWKRYVAREGASSAPDRITNYNSAGQQHGLDTIYFARHRSFPQRVSPYVNGKLHGEVITYFVPSQGDTVSVEKVVQTYANGVKYGPYEAVERIDISVSPTIGSNLRTIASGPYANDERHGTGWYELNVSDGKNGKEAGVLRAFEEYSGYTPIGRGTEDRLEGGYKNGNRYGKWMRYDTLRPGPEKCRHLTYPDEGGELQSNVLCN